MRNFLVTIKPESRQLYLNSILHNNEAVADNLLELKKHLVQELPMDDFLKLLPNKVGIGNEPGLWLLSAPTENIIDIVLSEQHYHSYFLNGSEDVLLETFNEDELSDYCFLRLKRTNPFKKDPFKTADDAEKWSNVTVIFENLKRDQICFDYAYNVLENIWDDFQKKVKTMIKEAEKDYDDYDRYEMDI